MTGVSEDAGGCTKKWHGVIRLSFDGLRSRDNKPDLQDAKVDLQDAKVTLQDAKVRLRDAKVGLQDARVE